MREHTAPRDSPKRDHLRSEGRSARRKSRAEGKLPVPGQLRRRGRGKSAANASGPVNLNQRECAVEQRHTDRRDDEQLTLLRKVGSGGQRAARLVAIAGDGRAMRVLLGATILFAEQARRINQAARNCWQPNERQHHRHDCLDPLHGRSNTTAAKPEQCGRWVLGGVGTHFDFNNRSAFAMTTSVAPVSARIASQRLVWPDKASTRNTAFTPSAKAMFALMMRTVR